MNNIGGINNLVNKSVLSSSFASSTATFNQAPLLASVYEKKIPDMTFTEDGTSESLSSIVNASLNQNSDVNLFSSMSQVNNYAVTESLLESAYGTSINTEV